MANNYTTTSLDALKYLCSVINKTVDLPSTVISDTSVATNTTYSSYKLDKEFTTLEDELKHYTDTAIAGLNKLTKEIINDKALVVKDNVLYLYKADDDASNNYMQMMLINGVAVELGSTQVDMTDYYNKTDSDNRFAAKLDLDTLTTSFNDLKTLIGDTGLLNNATLMEDVLELYTGLDGKVDNTDITTTISATSTDSEVPSAKAIYDTVKNIITSENFSYNADTDRTDTGNRIKAVKTVLTSLKNKYKSQFTYEGDVYNVSFEIRYKGGFYYSYIATCYYLGKKEIHVLEYSPNDGSMNLLYTDSGINNLYMNRYSKIFYNKDKTNLVETTNSGYTISGGYAIRNGVCYCNISIKCTTPVSYYTIITTQSKLGLPTSELVPCYLNFINDEQPSCISVYMGTENIEVRGGVAGKTYTYSGSFPIKVGFK